MKKLDFIIVGAMKAGTSSLAFQLKHNPQICIPLKEVHYFNNEENYNKGIQWYEGIFKDCNPENIIGEKTPTYSYLEKVPERIYEYKSDIKLVWIFRNPLSRSYSNYWHAVKSGRENYSFDKAVRKEPERLKKDVWKGYLKRSIYAEQIERYLNFFDKKQMYFMIFEDFVRNPVENMKGLFKFLRVSFNNFEYQDEIRNITIIPRIPRLLRKSSEIFHEKSLIHKGIQFLAIKRKKPGYTKISPEIKEELKHYFIDHNRKLADLTGLDVSIWDKNK
ncbi:MAG: sulfotransferase domain-containing protein [Candidatus Heimdallarchaeota archaeon]|nr:sulfotransferase domain-containing protein [Candidatus Heimdallarchaeota archaeon]